MFATRQIEIDLGNMRPRVPWKHFSPAKKAFGVPGPWDYWTNGAGDVFCLPLFDFAVGMIFFQNQNDVYWWVRLAAIFVGVGCAYCFYRMATKLSRALADIDWWFKLQEVQGVGGLETFVLGRAKVDVSIAGWVHLVYYAFQWAIGLLGIWLAFVKGDGWPIFVAIGLVGVAGYAVTYVLDLAQGHFA